MNVYAIVATYNGEYWIRKCISSLCNSSLLVHIKVVDNSSEDNTIKIIKSQYKDVDLIQLNTNIGFGKANNIGIKKALSEGADYFFLLNQDAWVEENTIEKLVNISKKYQNYGILSPMHLNADYSALDFNFSRYIIPDHCPDLYSDIYLNKVKDVYPIDFINAAAWMISKSCIEKVGLFDPLFFHYGEDRNYCHRVLYHGFKIGVCPISIIVHDRDNRKGVIEEYSGKEELRRLKLVEFCDIRKRNFKVQHLKFLVMNAFKGVAYGVTFHFKQAGDYFSEWLYFLRNRNKIVSSRCRNEKVWNDRQNK